MTKLHVGDRAPEFSLTNQNGEMFSLNQALTRRPVVLMFYTMDGTPNCNNLLCRVNEDLAQFDAAGLDVVGINFAEPDEHAAYAEHKFLKLPLLSDKHFQVSKAYDTLFEIGPIKAIRYCVVGIGQDGIIKYYQRGRPSNDEIITAMAAVGSAV